MSTTIDKDNDNATIINIFTVEPSKQEKLIEMLEEATEQIMIKQEGFVSANIHKSLDGTKVVNYAQWKSREAYEKTLNNPKVQIHMNDILTVANSIDGNLYKVVFTEEKI